MPKSNNKKVVVFDLDETLGSFGEFGLFCNLLDSFYNNKNKSYSIFNPLLDLYPEFIRPTIYNVLKYLIKKKKEHKCEAVMIYTNNNGERSWAEHIKSYFEYKCNSPIFEQIIAAFKINGEIIEVNRTTYDKTVDDFFRCTKLPKDTEICFIDDLFHPKMEEDNVYYIHVKPYKYSLSSNILIERFLFSNLSNDIPNKEQFTDFMKKNLPSNISNKSNDEQEIDTIVSKKMLEHIKEFFSNHFQSIDSYPITYDKLTFTKKHKKFKSKTLKKNKK